MLFFRKFTIWSKKVQISHLNTLRLESKIKNTFMNETKILTKYNRKSSREVYTALEPGWFLVCNQFFRSARMPWTSSRATTVQKLTPSKIHKLVNVVIFPCLLKHLLRKISLVLTPRLEPLYSRSIGRKKTFVNPYFSIFS